MKTNRFPAALLALLTLPGCSEQPESESRPEQTAVSANPVPEEVETEPIETGMLDIIRDSLIFDFGYLNSFALNTAGHLFVQLVRVGSTDFASSYAKNQKGYEKALTKMQEAYAD